MSSGLPFPNGTGFRNENARLRKCPGEGQVECHSVSFTPGALEMPGAPQKIKGAKVREKLATMVENQRKPNDMPCSDSFPPGLSRFFFSDDSKRNMEEIGHK